MRIAFLVQLPRMVSPGQRFRIEQYEPSLALNGIQFDTFPFIDSDTYTVLYKPGHYLQKFLGVIKGFCRRFRFLFRANRYDYIFLQREASPIGPPIFEWILTKVLRRQIILDFDDAIWVKDPSESNRLINAGKCYWKVKYLCKWSHKVCVGNRYLADYAAQFNKNVILIPTCVDTANRYNKTKDQNTEKVVIGWTGSHSTVKYLHLIYPVLKEIQDRFDCFEFVVICDRSPDFQLRSMRFVRWNEDTEIEDLLQINIGIMPLAEDQWSNGKCGFKLIQYLSLGIPAVASPVGVNQKIIENGVNGFLCNSYKEWEIALEKLISNVQARKDMGEHGRNKMVEGYSLQVYDKEFVGLFS